MEKNLINNSNEKTKYLNIAVNYLISAKIIDTNNLKDLNASYGYIFLLDNGNVEALFKIIISSKIYYFAVQKGNLMQLNIVEEMYDDIIKNIHKMHPCLNSNAPYETNKEKSRKIINNQKLAKSGIRINNNLICFFNEDNKPYLKSINEICERAFLSIIMASYAVDIHNRIDSNSLKETYFPIFSNFSNEMKKINKKEEKLFNKFTEQDLIELDWEFEAGWALLWALGLIDDDISKTNILCDCSRAQSIITSCLSIDDLVKKCNMKNIDEILDMHDLFYRYHWAINNSKINPETTIGNINPSCILERRRGLEWILSKEIDWYELDLNT